MRRSSRSGFSSSGQGFLAAATPSFSTAAALLIGSHDLLGFLWLGSLCTLISLLAVMIEYDLSRWLRRVLRPGTVCGAAEEGAGAEPRPTAPYGIAIAMGAVIILLFRAFAST